MSAARLPLRIVAAAAGVVAFGSLAWADAPPGQYAPFDLRDQSILDVKTGLRWQRYAAPPMSFAGAVSYCAGLSLDGFAAGAWRLPSYKELLTLVDESPHTEYPTGAPVQIAIDGNAFSGTAVDAAYWTSSPYPPMSGNGYAVDFSTGAGQDVSLGSSSLYVRCVHY
jgi:hypothetical protein